MEVRMGEEPEDFQRIFHGWSIKNEAAVWYKDEPIQYTTVKLIPAHIQKQMKEFLKTKNMKYMRKYLLSKAKEST